MQIFCTENCKTFERNWKIKQMEQYTIFMDWKARVVASFQNGLYRFSEIVISVPAAFVVETDKPILLFYIEMLRSRDC